MSTDRATVGEQSATSLNTMGYGQQNHQIPLIYFMDSATQNKIICFGLQNP
jgi:hypothetical protein